MLEVLVTGYLLIGLFLFISSVALIDEVRELMQLVVDLKGAHVAAFILTMLAIEFSVTWIFHIVYSAYSKKEGK